MNKRYMENFLGDEFIMPLPTFSADIKDDVLTDPDLRDGFIFDYYWYSLVMSKSRRQAYFSAANADFKRKGFVKAKSSPKNRKFKRDRRILPHQQLLESYYEGDYDQGHLTKRHAVARGTTRSNARAASNQSCRFTNIALQNKSFHKAEWKKIESAIAWTKTNLTDNFNVITGCVFTDVDERVQGDGEDAFAPAGFWKVISYIGKASRELEVNAFVSFQHQAGADALSDKVAGRSIEARRVYQTSTTLIERITGLEFDEVYKDKNPLSFFDNRLTAGAGANEINRPQLEEIVSGSGFV